MDRTPAPLSLAAALALPRTPGRSAEVFIDGDLEVRFAARPTNGPQVPHPRNRVAWVGGVHALSPTRVAGYAMRTYSGRPKSNIRFRTLVAIATSVACRPSVCERSPPPITHFQRAISASTRARQLYPDARCQPMRPRSAI